MFDLRAAKLIGPVNIARVRVLIQYGILRAFDINGSKVFESFSTEPKRRSGWRGHWVCKTKKGDLTMVQRCMTCGGWWRVAKRRAIDLWESGNAHA